MNLLPWSRDYNNYLWGKDVGNIDSYMVSFFEAFPFGLGYAPPNAPRGVVYQPDKDGILPLTVPKEEQNRLKG